MSYRNAINYLSSKTKVLELCNQFGGRVAVCPEWNGRVMTSSCDGLDGTSFGMINVATIDAGIFENAYNFFGGEDQFTLSPEGGPFNLYYAVDSSSLEKSLSAQDHIRIPVGFQEGLFSVDTVPPDPEVRMRRSLKMTNIAGAHFDLDVVRTVRLLAPQAVTEVFGKAFAVSLEQADVSYVGFETINSLINCGIPHTKLSGLVSFRIRSMFNSGQNTVAVVPFREGDMEEWGPSICADFFGSAPHGRLRVLPQAALLRADSKYRCQIGISRRRALPFLGSIDFREGVLTLVAFDLPSEPWTQDYLSNEYCETVSNTVVDFVNAREFYVDHFSGIHVPQSEEKLLELAPEEAPYSGEVVRAYNHGPSFPGEVLTSRFFEFDVYSPAKELPRGGSLTHRQSTIHINADNRTLIYLVQQILGVDYNLIYEKMMK